MKVLVDFFKDHWFKMVLIIITASFTLGATYTVITANINELNSRMHNLNEKVQSQNKMQDRLIRSLDSRYVGEEKFEEFRISMANQMKKIDENVNYLIRLEIEGRSENEQRR